MKFSIAFSFAVQLLLLTACAVTWHNSSSVTGSSQSADSTDVVSAASSNVQKAGYALGLEIMQSLRNDGLELDTQAFLQGVDDVLAQRSPRLSPEEITAVKDWQFVEHVKHQNLVAEHNLAAGRDFLAQNRTKSGVTTLASGLQYSILKDGTGNKPTPDAKALVHYRISKIDGSEVASTGKPTEVMVHKLIKGWQEALLLMPEGSRWRLFIPSGLAYGESGAPNGRLGPNEALICDLELLSSRLP